MKRRKFLIERKKNRLDHFKTTEFMKKKCTENIDLKISYFNFRNELMTEKEIDNFIYDRVSSSSGFDSMQCVID